MTRVNAPSAAGIGVVVIGRNEGERLRICLASVCDGTRPVVYVDSGSTDQSVEHARSMKAEVVELDMSRPFSAGRARNAGFERLAEVEPSVRYVQFVDGDCELAPAWLSKAAAALDRDPTLAIVCGRRRERFPDRAIYNALCDIEWDTPVGEAEGCGGDFLVRAEAFEGASGFHPVMVAGEEPELCVRLRKAGWRIQRLPEEMTVHDAAMFRFSQWWTRATRSGHAHAELAFLHGWQSPHPGVRETASNVFWAIGFPAALATTLRLSPFASLGVLMYPWLLARIYQRQITLGRTFGQAGIYAASCTLSKLPETAGAMRFWYGLLAKKPSRIIEYKR